MFPCLRNPELTSNDLDPVWWLGDGSDVPMWHLNFFDERAIPHLVISVNQYSTQEKKDPLKKTQQSNCSPSPVYHQGWFHQKVPPVWKRGRLTWRRSCTSTCRRRLPGRLLCRWWQRFRFFAVQSWRLQENKAETMPVSGCLTQFIRKHMSHTRDLYTSAKPSQSSIFILRWSRGWLYFFYLIPGEFHPTPVLTFLGFLAKELGSVCMNLLLRAFCFLLLFFFSETTDVVHVCFVLSLVFCVVGSFPTCFLILLKLHVVNGLFSMLRKTCVISQNNLKTCCVRTEFCHADWKY